MNYFSDFASFLSRQSSANSMRNQLEMSLAQAISPPQQHAHQPRPGSNDILKLEDARSIEEELCLVLDNGSGSHFASPRTSHAAPIAEAVSKCDMLILSADLHGANLTASARQGTFISSAEADEEGRYLKEKGF